MIVEIVILAMIAVFLVLRLYAVLGRRSQDSDEPLRRRLEQADPQATPRPMPTKLADKTPLAPRASAPAPEPTGFDAGAETGIRAIISADRRFDVTLFLTGAKAAYGMVLDTYWRGDKDALAQLCERAVYEGFAAAIDVRSEAGDAIDARLIRINDARIVSADYETPVARIQVRFVADIASVTRNGDGLVVAGSLNDAIESRDLWTFTRDLTSRDPDWQLDEADQG
ncbi:Tim44/TimA family putative adaptor protein [Novosphingobium sp.]|uniref:Tim44/TimA family putative adaptor protein n=1 Tax=Novosphingobium sp. TaxID=1874826 RepID=UPI003B51A82B